MSEMKTEGITEKLVVAFIDPVAVVCSRVATTFQHQQAGDET